MSAPSGFSSPGGTNPIRSCPGATLKDLGPSYDTTFSTPPNLRADNEDLDLSTGQPARALSAFKVLKRSGVAQATIQLNVGSITVEPSSSVPLTALAISIDPNAG
jgi:hypothetical protein